MGIIKMVLKDWKLSDYEDKYLVYVKQDNRIGYYNTFSLVIKTENGKWIVFIDGGDAGHKILYQPKTKKEAIDYAKAYMRKH